MSSTESELPVPELPEVETLRQDLAREAAARRIERVHVAQTRMLQRPLRALRGQTPDELTVRLRGRTILAVGRRGKELFVHLDSADALLLHRGMTGNLLLEGSGDPFGAHLHLVLSLDDGRELRLYDPRGFGAIRVLSADEVKVRTDHLGPEPLGPRFSLDYLAAQCARRRTPVKALLLSQSVVAGLGNLYSDEALWTARIHPGRPTFQLTTQEIETLHTSILGVLRAAIARRGTTFRDYADLYGRPGENGRYLRAFGRAGLPCLRCGETISKVNAAGRGSSVCPTCQTLPRL